MNTTNLVCYLPFDNSPTEDLCGNTWYVTGNPTVSNGELVLDGSGYIDLASTDEITLGGRDFTVSFYASKTRGDGGAIWFESSYGQSWCFDNIPEEFTHLEVDFIYQESRRYTFVNGVGTSFECTDFDASFPYLVTIGDGPNFVGRISNFVVYDGVALHTEDFEPPTAEEYAALKRALIKPEVSITKLYFNARRLNKVISAPMTKAFSPLGNFFVARWANANWYNPLVPPYAQNALPIHLTYGGNVYALSLPFSLDRPAIPALANSLCGFFTSSGDYHPYPIAGERWIANNSHTYVYDVGAVMDAEIASDGSVYTVAKNVTQLETDDYDYHEGFYGKTPLPLYSAINFGRIAVLCEGDRTLFYNHPVVGFQQSDYIYAKYYGLGDYLAAPFYSGGGTAYNSYEDGFYPEFENASTGNRIPMRSCRFLLTGRGLDYRKFDDSLRKMCVLSIRKGDVEVQRVNIGLLLQSFEKAAQEEVEFLELANRESVKHLKSRAVVRNFKINSPDDWELLLEAEIWASNTFYNNAEEPVSHNPLTLDTNPFHISSTVSHNHLLLKFRADGTCEEVFKWKFLYPLQLRDSTFDGYSFTEPETTVTDTGVWVVRTMKASAGTIDGKQRWYTETWREYDSRREANSLNYNTPMLEVADFDFPVQDGYQAKIKNLNEAIGQWQLEGIYDNGGTKIFGNVFPDTDAHTWNMAITPLEAGYLFGVHDGNLYKIINGNIELVGYGLKNFRLRELNPISNAKT